MWGSCNEISESHKQFASGNINTTKETEIILTIISGHVRDHVQRSKMALFRNLLLLLSYYVLLIVATTTDHSGINFFTEQTSQFDPNIDCDVGKLALDYAKKLQPYRGSFVSVYNALELQMCNITISKSSQTK